jgi:hypothetical protein
MLLREIDGSNSDLSTDDATIVTVHVYSARSPLETDQSTRKDQRIPTDISYFSSGRVVFYRAPMLMLLLTLQPGIGSREDFRVHIEIDGVLVLEVGEHFLKFIAIAIQRFRSFFGSLFLRFRFLDILGGSVRSPQGFRNIPIGAQVC